jgi:steroid 5-alpha reductase family enzyme
VAFNNSSFYDPYWSVAPVPIILVWYIHAGAPDGNPNRQWLIIALVSLWSFRLTLNWVRRWKGLTDEDWRYAGYRSFPRPLYWLISFAGFHLFPTLIVFAGCLSVYPAFCLSPNPIGFYDGIASIICLAGIGTEAIADRQLSLYIRNQPGKSFLSQGLWKFSRHPNYFGEILFWTGLFAFSLQTKPFTWYTLAGPLGMILMFSLISVPMMDKRMKERKPGYAEYAQRTSALIPWPNFK